MTSKNITRKMRSPFINGLRSWSKGSSGFLQCGSIAWRNRPMSPLFATSVVAKVIVTVAAKNHIAKATISARGLVTMVWYLKANFTAIKRSTLINARWRIMTEMRKKLDVEVIFPRGPELHSASEPFNSLRLICTMPKIKGIASKPSAVDKLTRITLEAVRRL